jgi:hypothetical protein
LENSFYVLRLFSFVILISSPSPRLMGSPLPATPEAFIDHCTRVEANERANSQAFFLGLAHVLAVPAPSNSHADGYSFEYPVKVPGGSSSNFIDLYRRGHFVFESKQFAARREELSSLEAAAVQAGAIAAADLSKHFTSTKPEQKACDAKTERRDRQRMRSGGETPKDERGGVAKTNAHAVDEASDKQEAERVGEAECSVDVAILGVGPLDDLFEFWLEHTEHGAVDVIDRRGGKQQASDGPAEVFHHEGVASAVFSSTPPQSWQSRSAFKKLAWQQGHHAMAGACRAGEGS